MGYQKLLRAVIAEFVPDTSQLQPQPWQIRKHFTYQRLCLLGPIQWSPTAGPPHAALCVPAWERKVAEGHLQHLCWFIAKFSDFVVLCHLSSTSSACTTCFLAPTRIPVPFLRIIMLLWVTACGLPEMLFPFSFSQIKSEGVSLRKQHSMSTFSDQQTPLKEKVWWQKSTGTSSFE